MNGPCRAPPLAATELSCSRDRTAGAGRAQQPQVARSWRWPRVAARCSRSAAERAARCSAAGAGRTPQPHGPWAAADRAAAAVARGYGSPRDPCAARPARALRIMTEGLRPGAGRVPPAPCGPRAAAAHRTRLRAAGCSRKSRVASHAATGRWLELQVARVYGSPGRGAAGAAGRSRIAAGVSRGYHDGSRHDSRTACRSCTGVPGVAHAASRAPGAGRVPNCRTSCAGEAGPGLGRANLKRDTASQTAETRAA
jgi:hypothetical protein